MNEARASSSRRADYAAMTRQDIVAAARRLYAERGFFATKVEDIAAAARVAPGTVHSAGGGKYGLLLTLMDQWREAPVIQATYQRVGQLEDGASILAATAAGTREVREEWGDVMRVVLTTAPNDPRVAAALAGMTAAYRRGVLLTAERLSGIGALKESLDTAAAADILWFYFGYASYFTLTAGNGWSLPQAEQWLLTQATAALLRDAPEPVTRS